MKFIGIREDGRSFNPPYQIVDYVPQSYPPEVLEKILRYLNPGDDWNCVCAVLCDFGCHRCKRRLLDGGCYMTDGEYVWPLTLRHQIQSHGFPFPVEFLEKMQLMKFKCPKVAPSENERIGHDVIQFLTEMDTAIGP